MPEPIISVEHVSKEYSIGEQRELYHTLRDSIVDWFKRKKGGARHPFAALNDISFTVQPGEVVGIIGRNGAGKSTLLKLLSRITDPTTGQIVMRGRVASLLEVGTGFHPELTGRENIYLSGAVLGMSKAEIEKKMDEIIAFAEVEKFIDTPVKRFSSGMYTRLAFSVAAHLDPEILVVDEVLAVGDTGFQKKCLGKMESVAQQGRTVLFVSHQLEFLAQLCQRCLFLDQGKIIADGPARPVIDQYVRMVRELTPTSLRDRRDRSGQGNFRFTETWVEDTQGHRLRQVAGGQSIKIVATYEVKPGATVSNLVISFALLTIRNVVVTDLGTDTTNPVVFQGQLPPRGRIECIIPRLPLNSGEFVYNVLARSAHSGQEVEDWIKQAGVFSVEPGDFYKTGHIPGPLTMMCIEHEWNVQAL